MRTLVIGSLVLVAMAFAIAPVVACYDLKPCSPTESGSACGGYPEARPSDAGRE